MVRSARRKIRVHRYARPITRVALSISSRRLEHGEGKALSWICQRRRGAFWHPSKRKNRASSRRSSFVTRNADRLGEIFVRRKAISLTTKRVDTIS